MWIKPLSPRIFVTDLEYFNKILMSKVHLTKTNIYDVVKSYVGQGLGINNNSKCNMYSKAASKLIRFTIKCLNSR